MADNFDTLSKGLTAPADKHWSITPHDDEALDPKPRALWVNADGDLALEDSDGTSLTYAVTVGMVIPFRATHVLATGTTATVYRWE